MNETQISYRQAKEIFGIKHDSEFYKVKKELCLTSTILGYYDKQEVEQAVTQYKPVVMPVFRKTDEANENVYCKSCYRTGLRLFQYNFCADCLNGITEAVNENT